MRHTIACLSAVLGVVMVGSAVAPAIAASPPNPQPVSIDRQQPQTVVARIWHGRTLTTKADAYYQYLNTAGIQKILAIPGNLGAEVLRRTDGRITEFTVISYWVSRDAIRQFAGQDIEKAHYLPKDPEYLLELEPHVRHFDVVFAQRKP